MQLAAEGRRQRALRRPLLALLGLYLSLMLLPFFHPPPGLFAIIAAGLFSITFGFGIYLRLSVSRFHNIAPERLSQIDDRRAVGPLLEALDIPDTKTRRAVTTALIRLLPQLREDDGRLLTDTQREGLYRALEPPKLLGFSQPGQYDKNLVVAVLQALEQIGEEYAIPHVEALERSSPYVSVRKAAKTCRSHLESRYQTEQIRARRTLLRAAQMEDRTALELPRTAPPPATPDTR
jgi:hypothetical protein